MEAVKAEEPIEVVGVVRPQGDEVEGEEDESMVRV